MVIQEGPGELTIQADQQLNASLHYLVLQPHQWVLEQLFVRPGQPVSLAVDLIKRFTYLAQAAQVTVKLLDPYAKRYFTQHPVPALLADHQLPITGPDALQPVELNYHTEEE